LPISYMTQNSFSIVQLMIGVKWHVDAWGMLMHRATVRDGSLLPNKDPACSDLAQPEQRLPYQSAPMTTPHDMQLL